MSWRREGNSVASVVIQIPEAYRWFTQRRGHKTAAYPLDSHLTIRKTVLVSRHFNLIVLVCLWFFCCLWSGLGVSVWEGGGGGPLLVVRISLQVLHRTCTGCCSKTQPSIDRSPLDNSTKRWLPVVQTKTPALSNQQHRPSRQLLWHHRRRMQEEMFYKFGCMWERRLEWWVPNSPCLNCTVGMCASLFLKLTS